MDGRPSGCFNFRAGRPIQSRKSVYRAIRICASGIINGVAKMPEVIGVIGVLVTILVYAASQTGPAAEKAKWCNDVRHSFQQYAQRFKPYTLKPETAFKAILHNPNLLPIIETIPGRQYELWLLMTTKLGETTVRFWVDNHAISVLTLNADGLVIYRRDGIGQEHLKTMAYIFQRMIADVRGGQRPFSVFPTGF